MRCTCTATTRPKARSHPWGIEDDEEYEIVADAFDELLDAQEYDELIGEDELEDME